LHVAPIIRICGASFVRWVVRPPAMAISLRPPGLLPLFSSLLVIGWHIAALMARRPAPRSRRSAACRCRCCVAPILWAYMRPSWAAALGHDDRPRHVAFRPSTVPGWCGRQADILPPRRSLWSVISMAGKRRPCARDRSLPVCGELARRRAESRVLDSGVAAKPAAHCSFPGNLAECRVAAPPTGRNRPELRECHRSRRGQFMLEMSSRKGSKQRRDALEGPGTGKGRRRGAGGTEAGEEVSMTRLARHGTRAPCDSGAKFSCGEKRVAPPRKA
jgi:hypothetical protein